MKIPFSVDKNIFKIYEPSKIALSLVQEAQREVQSENPNWDENHVPKLTELCLLTIAANFEENIVLNELPCWDRDRLLEILPTNLPLELAINNIHDEIYWERRVKDRWKDRTNYCKEGGNCWKRLYLERHVQEVIEAMTPEGYDPEIVEKLCNLAKDYVEVLNLRELQIMQPPILMGDEDEFNIFTEPTDHIDLEPIISGFQNLRELHIQFGLRNVGSEYKKILFQFSIQDCMNLGEGIAKSQNLRLLRLHSCNLDDSRLTALLSKMDRNRSLEELDFSNCLIEDEGAAAIAVFTKNKKKLKRLNLCNNKIKEDGITAIAFMMAHENNCFLEKLNLKFNRFGDAGFKCLTSGLVRDGVRLKSLNVSCCDLQAESGIFLAETLTRNFILLKVDISNNRLGESAGRALKTALESNQVIQSIDLRMTEIPDEDMENIYDTLFFNRIRTAKGESGVAREIKMREKRAAEERVRLEKEAAAAAAAEAKALEEEAAKLAAKTKEDED